LYVEDQKIIFSVTNPFKNSMIFNQLDVELIPNIENHDDAFYASVEQMDNPLLWLVIGGSENRGAVAAASYEARKFEFEVQLVVLWPKKLSRTHLCTSRFDRYKEISSKTSKDFFEYTDLVEPLSLDEAYLDVTNNKKRQSSNTISTRNKTANFLTKWV
jgi:DNA polymerase-4